MLTINQTATDDSCLTDAAGGMCAAVLPLARGRFAVIDERDEAVAAHRWCMASGYAARAVPRSPESRKKCRSRQVLVYLHRHLCGATEGLEVDHINRVRHDCRRRNLRLCTTAENSRNCSSTRNTSGCRGVQFRMRYVPPTWGWVADPLHGEQPQE